YITKPFDPSQLVARVRSHLKRYARLTKERDKEEAAAERIRIQDLVIEPKTWKVWKGETELKLPNREFELLRFLAENPNIVFSKETLFERIWGYDYVSDAATVSVHVNRLREKIEDDSRNPKIIETVWGAGYRLNG
ncbi:MAG: winged helix-turn-helix domain-containing protein, partial [Blautia sp.]